MTEKTDIEKLKQWIDQEIIRLTKEGASIENTKHYRETAYMKKYAFQDIRNELNNIPLK